MRSISKTLRRRRSKAASVGGLFHSQFQFRNDQPPLLAIADPTGVLAHKALHR
jgi:hypothetical protein